jgi:hypothetical protein
MLNIKLTNLVTGAVLLAVSATAMPAQAEVVITPNQIVVGEQIARGFGRNNNRNDDYYENDRHNRGHGYRGRHRNKKKHHNQGRYSNNNSYSNNAPVIYVPQTSYPQQSCMNTRFGRVCR